MVRDIIEKNEKVNPNVDLLKKLKSLIPGVIAKDGSIDADAIRYWAERATGDSRLVTEERETFNFLGKDYARLLYALDTEQSLLPTKRTTPRQRTRPAKTFTFQGTILKFSSTCAAPTKAKSNASTSTLHIIRVRTILSITIPLTLPKKT